MDIVVAGAGAKGIAYLGAISALRKGGYKIRTVAGSSAGGLAAILYAFNLDDAALLRLGVLQASLLRREHVPPPPPQSASGPSQSPRDQAAPCLTAPLVASERNYESLAKEGYLFDLRYLESNLDTELKIKVADQLNALPQERRQNGFSALLAKAEARSGGASQALTFADLALFQKLTGSQRNLILVTISPVRGRETVGLIWTEGQDFPSYLPGLGGEQSCETLPIGRAACATAAIPLVFRASEKGVDYMDGGLLSNFPIKIVKDTLAARNLDPIILGIEIGNSDAGKGSEIWTVINNVVRIVMYHDDEPERRALKTDKRLLTLSSYGISTLDFNSPALSELFERARRDTEEWLPSRSNETHTARVSQERDLLNRGPRAFSWVELAWAALARKNEYEPPTYGQWVRRTWGLLPPSARRRVWGAAFALLGVVLAGVVLGFCVRPGPMAVLVGSGTVAQVAKSAGLPGWLDRVPLVETGTLVAYDHLLNSPREHSADDLPFFTLAVASDSSRLAQDLCEVARQPQNACILPKTYFVVIREEAEYMVNLGKDAFGLYSNEINGCLRPKILRKMLADKRLHVSIPGTSSSTRKDVERILSESSSVAFTWPSGSRVTNMDMVSSKTTSFPFALSIGNARKEDPQEKNIPLKSEDCAKYQRSYYLLGRVNSKAPMIEQRPLLRILEAFQSVGRHNDGSGVPPTQLGDLLKALRANSQPRTECTSNAASGLCELTSMY